MDAPTRGVYFAGFCESPKDIKDSVCQAGAASSRAGALLNKGRVAIEAITSMQRIGGSKAQMLTPEQFWKAYKRRH